MGEEHRECVSLESDDEQKKIRLCTKAQKEKGNFVNASYWQKSSPRPIFSIDKDKILTG